MIRYRIILKEDNDGFEYYQVERGFFFIFWVYLKLFNTNGGREREEALQKAKNYINNCIKKDKHKHKPIYYP